MTDELAWTEDPHTLFKFRVVRVMATGESDCVDIAHALTAGPEDVSEVFAELVAEGLAGHAPLRGGDRLPHDAMLKVEDRALVRRCDGAATPAAVKRACTAAMLSWLDAREGERVAHTFELAEDVRGHFYGVPFPNPVMYVVGQELREAGLIKIAGAASGGPHFRPTITALGRAVLARHGGDLAAWAAANMERGGDTFHITDSTGVVVANRSPGTHQTVHVTSDVREQTLNLAAALEQMYPSALGLEPAELARAAGLVVQLREAADKVETDPGKLRRLLGVLREVAVSGAGGAAGTGLVALAEVIAQNLS